MPFAKKIETEIGVLGIWELTETPEMLMLGFDFFETENAEFTKIKFDKRKTEYLATRLLLKELIKNKTEIFYEKSGKPRLKNSTLHLSISHSANLLAALVSEKNVGIDVELENRNIDRVADRFLCSEELDSVKNCGKPQTAKILYWCAKESIFKCTGFEGVQFDEQIRVLPFEIEEQGIFAGKLTAGKTVEYYKLWYFSYQNNCVVYCVAV